MDASTTPGYPVGARGYERFSGVVRELASQSTPSWPAEVRAPDDAPNVVLVLVDDLGFSDISPFGGEIDTPHLREIAEAGYRFTNYHTSTVCAPARASLLTGLNPHRAGFATVAGSSPGYPGFSAELPSDAPTLAESFRAAGYATFMVGKWHLTPSNKLHDGAEKSSWPVQRGFDRYYGCMDAYTTLFQPHRLMRDNSPITVDEYDSSFYLTDALTAEAESMIAGLRANDPTKPFFLYFAHQAAHAPLQAKADDIQKYRGRYEAGWDVVRARREARQREEGLFPDGGRPSPRDAELTAWDELTEAQQRWFARCMEVYAAIVDTVDQSLGRIVAQLKAMGEYDNTIIAFTSDNGASGEGGDHGTATYLASMGAPTDLALGEAGSPMDLDEVGGPRSMMHYPRGWASVSNTPFAKYKRFMMEGGIRAPLIVSWPRGLPRRADDQGLRAQYAYVSDLGQTLLALAGVVALPRWNGREVPSVDGVRFDDVLRDPRAASPHAEQYAEFAGSRAFSSGRWKILTEHRAGEEFSDAEWRLYDMEEDPCETVDLAPGNPELVARLAARWREEAWRNTVFPLNDDGTLTRTRPSSDLRLERPTVLRPASPTLERFRSNRLIRLRSFEVIVRFVAGPDGEGVLFAHGDQGGGYVAFIEDDRFCISYNEYGRMHRASAPLGARFPEVIRVTFTAEPGIRWGISATIDGARALDLGPVLQMAGAAPFTGISVGVDRGSPVDAELHERRGPFRCTGALESVEYRPGPRAEYNTEIIVDIDRAAASRSD
ncbi:arylsulfatase [Microbacterium capsulatum]|uniref:Arylsulfatase n=1 Tax=Microbacterium capsulatum TaxID=3041921 RepID=A0ABU0XHQ1_9MICO|nr:arylsulfatase [Microbacterium sp. ASV81]MDQ4214643.1 arylsulfatase [Microbacterium sp. ASV81]